MDLNSQLKRLVTLNKINAIDRHFAYEILKIENTSDPILLYICILVSLQTSKQCTCLDLNLVNLSNLFGTDPAFTIDKSLDELIKYLASFNAITIISEGNQCVSSPLVLDGNLLYLNGNYFYETSVSRYLLDLASCDIEIPLNFKSLLDPLFDKTDELDWQKVATIIAATRRLCIINGGPGTGKTRCVTKILYLLQSYKAHNIKLVAPTGKAAARLSESIKNSKLDLVHLSTAILDKIPNDATTLHRLLGTKRGQKYFTHNAEHKLVLDVLILDESSMVDLSLMYHLLLALPKNAKLILLGDHNQLASVESGSLLADICFNVTQHIDSKMYYSDTQIKFLNDNLSVDLSLYTEPSSSVIGDCICMLRKSYRFDPNAGIGILANAINNEQYNFAIWNDNHAELEWFDAGDISTFINFAASKYKKYLSDINSSPIVAIEEFNNYRVLCATQTGAFGVLEINDYITKALTKQGLIRPDQEFYLGRPILILSNDYNLGVYNGDVGIIMMENNILMAYFIKDNGQLFSVLPARLPKHQTCFAMTVHKSQGSEFPEVTLVLPLKPSLKQMQILTKEMVYTAITRAKEHFSCFAVASVFSKACNKRISRVSGLASRLWN